MRLLLGNNGAGKSAIFDLLDKIRRFVVDKDPLGDHFSASDQTRPRLSSSPDRQTFELTLAGNGGEYLYRLEIEHAPNLALARMVYESLYCNGEPLFVFDGHDAQLYRDNHSQGPRFPHDWSRSGVGMLVERPDNTRLTWFKQRLEKILVVRLNPLTMGQECRKESRFPDIQLSNYASWYWHLSGEQQEKIIELTMALRQILPGFHAFKLAEAGEAKILYVGFAVPSGKVEFFQLQQLSDGQRVLIALYTLVYCLSGEDATLCVDEPENFLAMPEIQVWLDMIDQKAQDGELQALLISHHPRIINFLAQDGGLWLARDGQTGPTRIKPITLEQRETTGLPIARLVEMGWISDE
ncbi:MAG: ATP-binding protein [Magnetococcales bacterium]|nr:ATP-binding protein [Magnetococcales bacterium]